MLYFTRKRIKEKNMKIAIIGCGVTGMSAGITLQNAGFDTVIFEKMDTPGGVISVYKRDILINNALEFVFGTALGTFSNDMWQSLGMFRKPPEEKNCFNRFLWNNHSISIYSDFRKTAEEMILISPEDRKRILRLEKSVDKFRRIELPLLTGASNNIPRRLFNLLINCFAVIPDIMGYSFVNFRQYSRIIRKPELKEFFSDVLNSKRSVLQYIVLWSFYSSGNFGTPDNNQQEMTETLYDNYINSGGKVKFNHNLNNIIFNGKYISALNFSDSSEYDFDYVIFTNDISSVNKIIKASGKKPPISEKAISKEHITSSCMLYFSSDSPIDLMHENISIPCAPFTVGVRCVDRFSVRLQKNTKTEKSAVSITLYQNENDYKKWAEILNQGEKKYNDEKLRVAKSVLSAIEKKFPDLKNKLQLTEITTPLTYEYFTGSNYGGWMSESFNPFIYLRCGKGHMPGIKNASAAGQKLFPIGGTTIGAYSGVKLAERIIRSEKKKTKTHFLTNFR